MQISYTPPADNKLTPAGEYEFEVIKFAVSQTTEDDVEKLKKVGFTKEQIADAEDGEIIIRKVAFTVSLTPEGGDPFNTKETFTLTPNMLWKLKQFRAACGFDDGEGKEVRFELEDLIGKTGNVKVTTKKKLKGDGDFSEFTWLKPSTEPF
jgi:hypothetical protein